MADDALRGAPRDIIAGWHRLVAALAAREIDTAAVTHAGYRALAALAGFGPSGSPWSIALEN